jgi:hypothetical protein
MTRKAAAAFLNESPDMLSCWRLRGTGPKYSWVQWGIRRVALYERVDLERWQATQAARAAKPTQRQQRVATRAANLARLPANALSYADAAAVIGMTEAEFRAQVSRGRGPRSCGHVGLKFFFRAADVRAWIVTRPKLAAALAGRGRARARSAAGDEVAGAVGAEQFAHVARADRVDGRPFGEHELEHAGRGDGAQVLVASGGELGSLLASQIPAGTLAQQ